MPFALPSQVILGRPGNRRVVGGGSPTPPPPGYTTGAVTFDGVLGLTLASLACVDTPYVSFSGWFNPADLTGQPAIWVSDPLGVFSEGNIGQAPGDGAFTVYMNSSDPNSVIAYAETPFVVGQWSHVLYAGEFDLDAGLKPIQIYVNGVECTDIALDSSPAFSPAMNGLGFLIGNDGFGDIFNGCMADFWFSRDNILEVNGTISPTTLSKFISPAGKPVDLGANGQAPTGTSPTIFLRQDPADMTANDFATNLGTGGDFIVTGGALAICTSSPSD